MQSSSLALIGQQTKRQGHQILSRKTHDHTTKVRQTSDQYLQMSYFQRKIFLDYRFQKRLREYY